MRPVMSWICTKLTLPWPRLSNMRPATFTWRAEASTSSASLPSNSRLQVAGERVRMKIVREGDALPAQRAQFFAALGNESISIWLVFVLRC